MVQNADVKGLEKLKSDLQFRRAAAAGSTGDTTELDSLLTRVDPVVDLQRTDARVNLPVPLLLWARVEAAKKTRGNLSRFDGKARPLIAEHPDGWPRKISVVDAHPGTRLRCDDFCACPPRQLVQIDVFMNIEVKMGSHPGSYDLR